MDWFKQNPFLGILALVTAVLTLGSAYFLYNSYSRYQEEVLSYEEQKSALGRLQSNKPFPNEENVGLAKRELDGARTTLGEIGKSFEVEVPAATPQGFQDLLREKVNDIVARAEANGVGLGEGFYLGFEAYETQPPSASAAGPLTLQLESIHAVAGVLVDSKVKEITKFVRPPLAAEMSQADNEEADAEDRRAPRKDRESKNADPEGSLPDLVLAPFDVIFTADQFAFRNAFNRVLETKPSVFVRLLGVTNTSPAGPSKTAEAGQETTDPGIIKPVLGQELAIVNLRLASVSTGTADND